MGKITPLKEKKYKKHIMIIRIGKYVEFVNKLNENPTSKDKSDEFNVLLENGKRLYSATTRDTICIEGLMKEYPKYKFHFHTMSIFFQGRV